MGLTPIIEELEELNLLSTEKKVKDDSTITNSLMVMNRLEDRQAPTTKAIVVTDSVSKRLEAQFQATLTTTNE